MARVARMLCVLLFLGGLGLRTAHLHAHDPAMPEDSCAACRILLSPIGTVPVNVDVQPLTTAPPELTPAPADWILPSMPAPGGLGLRAPPAA
jgi:hypothetical protein